jgi:hypothetical protein
VKIKIATEKNWKSKNPAESFPNSQAEGLAGQTVDYEIVREHRRHTACVGTAERAPPKRQANR